jgi:hypothetical protein
LKLLVIFEDESPRRLLSASYVGKGGRGWGGGGRERERERGKERRGEGK